MSIASSRTRKRLVVKVGSSLVTNDGRGLDHAAVARWAAEIAQLKRGGREDRAGVLRRDRRGHARLGWTRAAEGDPRTAGRGRRRPDGPRAGLRSRVHAIRPAHRAGAADARRPRRPPPLPQCAHDAAHAARTGRDPDHQRERHRHHRRNPLRRQRHAGRAGHQPDRGRRAGHPHRPGRASTRPIRASIPTATLVREARAGDPALEAMAGGAGSALGARRHADQDPRGQARRALRRVDRHRLRARAERADAARRRRGDRHAADRADRCRWARASNGWPTTCSSPAGSRSMPAP